MSNKSFSHKFDIVFICRIQVEKTFTIAAKVPSCHNFPRLQRQPFYITDSYPLVRPSAKLTVTKLLTSFL